MEYQWRSAVTGICILLLGIAEKAGCQSSGPTVTAESVGPTWIALRIRDPAHGYSGLQVLSYTILFGALGQGRMTEFELERRSNEENGTVINVEGLEPQQVYEFHIIPVLVDGTVGPNTTFVQRTASSEPPDPVTITSSRMGRHPHKYRLTWNTPFYTGGAEILGYEVKYSQATLVNTTVEPWQAIRVSLDLKLIMVLGQYDTSRTLSPLLADTYYAVTVRAMTSSGDVGPSQQSSFVFKTAEPTSCAPREAVAVHLITLSSIVAVMSLCHPPPLSTARRWSQQPTSPWRCPRPSCHAVNSSLQRRLKHKGVNRLKPHNY